MADTPDRPRIQIYKGIITDATRPGGVEYTYDEFMKPVTTLPGTLDVADWNRGRGIMVAHGGYTITETSRRYLAADDRQSESRFTVTLPSLSRGCPAQVVFTTRWNDIDNSPSSHSDIQAIGSISFPNIIDIVNDESAQRPAAGR